MDIEGTRRAYENATKPPFSGPQQELLNQNYSNTPFKTPTTRKTYDDYIVVRADNQSMVCRSRNGLMFEYDILAYFPNHHEACQVAKILNEQEGAK